MTAITIATFAIRLNMFITLLTAGIHHLQRLTAHPVETASLFGSCTVSSLIRSVNTQKKAAMGNHARRGLYWSVFEDQNSAVLSGSRSVE